MTDSSQNMPLMSLLTNKPLKLVTKLLPILKDYLLMLKNNLPLPLPNLIASTLEWLPDKLKEIEKTPLGPLLTKNTLTV